MSKFSYILLGLVATFSSFVLFTVYLGSTNAFVSAQTSIDLDLGNGFPGTTLTDSFTIENIQNDTTAYELKLEASLDPDAEDIRPHLMVWKPVTVTDPDSDGPMAGYSAPGSFTQDLDTADTWYVSFDVPDITLTGGTVLLYDCRIVIEPVVAGPAVVE